MAGFFQSNDSLLHRIMAYLPSQMTLNSYIDTKMGFLYSFPDLTREAMMTLNKNHRFSLKFYPMIYEKMNEGLVICEASASISTLSYLQVHDYGVQKL